MNHGNEIIKAPAEFVVKRFAGGEVGRSDQNGVAVSRCARDEFRADVGGSAWLVFHDH